MWKIWRLKNRVREILTEKKGVGVVEVILILVVLIGLQKGSWEKEINFLSGGIDETYFSKSETL